MVQKVHFLGFCTLLIKVESGYGPAIEALHVTYDTLSMADCPDCSNAFKRSMIITPTLPFVSLVMKSLLSL